MVSARSHREAGFGINGVVVTVLIISVLMGIIGTMVISGLFQTKSTVGETVGGALSEAAATKLTRALRSGLVSPVDGYTLTEADLRAVSAGAEVLPHGANPDVPDPYEARERGFDQRVPLVSVREHGDADGIWQVLRIVPPRAGVSRDVVVWVRTISHGGTGPSSVNTYAITLRDTPFSSYQMVSDSDIAFDASASISGNVHANGTTASHVRDIVRAASPATCAAGARVSTARGPIDPASFPGCTVRADTGRVLDVAGAADMVRTIESLCSFAGSGGNIRCVGAPGAGNEWDVTLSGDSVQWRCAACADSGSVALPSAADAARPGTVLLFRGGVNVAGTTSGRVTIVGWDLAAQSPTDSWIVGNIAPTSPTASVGLVAQGDIGVTGGAQPNCGVSMIQAALLANGRLTLVEDVRAAVDSEQACAQLDLVGSVTGREPPLLSLAGAAGTAGWTSRRYGFDARLLRTPPPMFPEAAQWKVARSRVLPSGCAVDVGGASRVLTDDQARTC
jgi:hypothetical protein